MNEYNDNNSRQQELIHLKQVKQGMTDNDYEKEKEADKEKEIVPKTFSQKLENFWYHYKVVTLLTAFFVFVFGVLTYTFLTREKYDFSVAIVTQDAKNYTTLEAKQLLDKISPDVDKNGKVNININDINIKSGESPSNSVAGQKLMTSFIDESTVIYIIDPKVINENIETGFVDLSDILPGNEKVDGYKYSIADTEFEKVTGLNRTGIDMVVCLRDFSNGNEKQKKLYENAKDVIKKIASDDFEKETK